MLAKLYNMHLSYATQYKLFHRLKVLYLVSVTYSIIHKLTKIYRIIYISFL